MSTQRKAGPELGVQARRRLLLGGFVLAALLIVGRAFQLQALEGEQWARIAADQQRERRSLPARRGRILDRDGVPLALSYETFQLSVAPRELNDPGRVAGELRRVLGLSSAASRRATRRERRWVVLPGRFTAEQFQQLAGVRGLHWERRTERFYPQGEIAREVLGSVAADGRAQGGMEQEMDSVLRGSAGYSVLRRDARGRAAATVSLPVVRPVDGEDVYLTLDLDMQEIADAALREAIVSTGASGGDLLITDPNTGDLLAAVSRRPGRTRGLSAFTEPYEPGSTLKPFFVASLLAERRASLADVVDGENGAWRSAEGRRVSDVHPYGPLSVRDALRVSSNVVMAKLSARIPPGEQFSHLRDFGFGTPTGVAFPAESGGRLPRPAKWSAFTPASLAMGYEVAATPLQLAMAYGALANGGVLMAPRLVREARDSLGATVFATRPEPIRRAVPREVARAVGSVLASVVEEGTGTRASLSSFAVAGKTGTSRRTGPGGRYRAGSYTASFVGYFPADDPQLVILVKLDEPQGSYYGGTTAAPVTRETLRAVLAARSSALNAPSLVATGAAPRGASGGNSVALPERDGTYTFVLDGSGSPAAAPDPAREISLPPLRGMSLREAARRLHRLGLQVRLEGSGPVSATRPAEGSAVFAGDTVTLVGSGW